MYQPNAYPDPLIAAASSYQSSSPLPVVNHHQRQQQQQQHHRLHHGNSYYLYPHSPQQRASPSSDSGSFLSTPASYASSLPTTYLQRSSSALSLHKHVFDNNLHHGGGGGGGNNSYLCEQTDHFDFQPTGSIRRVCSAGDIEATNNLQPENYCSQEIGGNGAAAAAPASGKVECYSAEKRKERIERYRSKRSQRNFQKKITYACRKTLADSRPRVRGRFARNGETELEAEAEAEAEIGEINGCGGNSSFHAGAADYYGWAGPAVDDEEDCTSDPDFWANFFNGLSVNTAQFSPNDMYGNDG